MIFYPVLTPLFCSLTSNYPSKCILFNVIVIISSLFSKSLECNPFKYKLTKKSSKCIKFNWKNIEICKFLCKKSKNKKHFQVGTYMHFLTVAVKYYLTESIDICSFWGGYLIILKRKRRRILNKQKCRKILLLTARTRTTIVNNMKDNCSCCDVKVNVDVYVLYIWMCLLWKKKLEKQFCN